MRVFIHSKRTSREMALLHEKKKKTSVIAKSYVYISFKWPWLRYVPVLYSSFRDVFFLVQCKCP